MDFREMLYITTVADCAASLPRPANFISPSRPSATSYPRMEQNVGVKLFDRELLR